MKTNNVLKIILLLLFSIGIWGNSYSAETAKIKIKSVTFKGNNAFSNHRLYKIILSRPSSFLNPSNYYPEVFQDDLKGVKLFYQQNGYLEAEITSYEVKTDTISNEAHIKIEISEGELTRIEGVGILGNKIFSDEKLREFIDIRVGEPFLSKKIEEANLKLLTFFANNGYLVAEVIPNIRVNKETHLVLMDFNINEKNQFTIEKTNLIGLEKAKPNIVLRELNFRSGDIINYSQMLESQRQIYLTGLFQSVFIRPQKASNADSTKRDILIELKENMSGEFNVALGYGSVEKVRGRMEIFNNNLLGTARKVGFTSKLSFIHWSVETSFTEPRMFNTRWQTDINLLRAYNCLLYTSPSPRDQRGSRMPSSA